MTRSDNSSDDFEVVNVGYGESSTNNISVNGDVVVGNKKDHYQI